MSQRSAQRAFGGRPRSRRARSAAALLALLAVAGYGTFLVLTSAQPARCTVRAGAFRLSLVPQQAANAATIGAVAYSRNLPERALAIALATAMQESRLRDLPGGDRDSLGLFQQRPSQGWGSAEQIMDPVFATNAFFDQLVAIRDYRRLPLTVAAQRVQRSGYPRAYARHEAAASRLAAALTGRAPGLTCRMPAPRAAGDPAAVRRRLVREFGALPLRRPGTAAAGSGPVGVAGRTVIVPGADGPDGAGPGRGRRGWVLAQWAVAHAQGLRVAEVSYAGRTWRAAASGRGWVADPRPAGPGYREVRITVAG